MVTDSSPACASSSKSSGSAALEDDVAFSHDSLEAAEVFASAVESQPILRTRVLVAGRPAEAIVDSGSSRTLVADNLVPRGSIDVDGTCLVRAIGNREIKPLGTGAVEVDIHGVKLQLSDCLVLKKTDLPTDVVIGRDSLERLALCVDVPRRSLSGRRPDGSRWTLCLPLDLQHDDCLLFAADVTCRAEEDVDVAPGSTVSLSYSHDSFPACSGCMVSQRLLFFEGHEGSEDVDYVSGIADLDEHKALVTNRGRLPVRVRRGSVVGRLVTAVDATLDLTEEHQVFAASVEEGCAQESEDLTAPSAQEIPGLSSEQRAEVEGLFRRHATVFSQSAADPLRTSLTAHRIVLTDDTPVYIPPRRMSPPVAEEIERQCLDLERLGIIERCDSAWSAPVVPVRKRDGTLRLCIDYRRLNARTVTSRFPMADVTDSVYSAHGMKFFTTLDLTKGYYQVPLEESSRDFTAFSTPRQHWRFRRLSFGLKNAPAAFQREMQTVLQAFPRRKVIVYLDDLLLMEETFEKHLQLVDDVLSALESQGIKLNAAKCVWMQSEVPFLGHIISEKGLRKSPEFIEKVRDMERPRTVRQLRQFLGVINFQRKFVPNCSSISKPLTELTGQPGSTELTWTEPMITAFDALKLAMEEEVTLAFPDYSPDAEPLTLWTDASEVGAGACLTQVQDGETRFIGFASMTFTRPQQRYSVTERELAALRWGVKTFKPFLGGVQFRLYTDHQALAYLHSMHLVNHRLARTMEELAEFDFTIHHVPGASNVAADLFSRANHEVPKPSVDPSKLPPGLTVWHRPEGGGDALVECLVFWLKENGLDPAENHQLREVLVDEVTRNPARLKMKLDRRTRQALKLMRIPGQPLSVELLAAFAAIFRTRVIVHFGVDHPMIFASLGEENKGSDAVHLQCLGGVHFNLLVESKSFQRQSSDLVAYIEQEVKAMQSRRKKRVAFVASAATEELKPQVERVSSRCSHKSHSSCSVEVNCNGKSVCALLDSGAAVSLISSKALDLIGASEEDIMRSEVSVRGVGGPVTCAGFLEARVSLSADQEPHLVRLLVDHGDSFNHCLLLGANFLTSAQVSLDFERRLIMSCDAVLSMNDRGLPAGPATGLTIVSASQTSTAEEADLASRGPERVPAWSVAREHQQQDRQLRALLRHVRRGTSSSKLPARLKIYRKHFGRLEVKEETLAYRHSEHGLLPVITTKWLAELVMAAHEEMAHIGRDKLFRLISSQVFCPGMNKVVADVVRTCIKCQLFKTSAQKLSAPVQRIDSEAPFELAAADLVMFPRTPRGFIGCLVVVDHFSKWAVAVPVRCKTSAAVAVALEQRVLPTLLRRPARLLTDNGREFVGPEFQDVLKRWGIRQTFSTPYRPQGNGAVERLNRTLGQALRLLADEPHDWDLCLPRAMATYNGSLHADLGESPADFLLKRQHDGVSVPLISAEKQRCWRPGHPDFAPFEVGDLVKRETQRPGNQLTNKFEQRFDGPFTVKSRCSNGVTYVLRSESGDEVRAHHTQLRPWNVMPAYLRRASTRLQDDRTRHSEPRRPVTRATLPAGTVIPPEVPRGVSLRSANLRSVGQQRSSVPDTNEERQHTERFQQLATRRTRDGVQQTLPDGQQTVEERQYRDRVQQVSTPRASDGVQQTPPDEQRTVVSSAEENDRELPRRSSRIRRPPDRWGW